MERFFILVWLTAAVFACSAPFVDHAPAPAAGSGGEATSTPVALELAEAIASDITAIDDVSMTRWESKVRAMLLDAYDRDRSGSIDTDEESDGIDCVVWQAIDDGHRRRTNEDESMRDAYGFAPDQPYLDVLGVDRGQRERLRVGLLNCSVR